MQVVGTAKQAISTVGWLSTKHIKNMYVIN